MSDKPTLTQFPHGYLSEQNISHESLPFKRIQELHAALWAFVHIAIPGAGGHLDEYVGPAFDALSHRDKSAEAGMCDGSGVFADGYGDDRALLDCEGCPKCADTARRLLARPSVPPEWVEAVKEVADHHCPRCGSLWFRTPNPSQLGPDGIVECKQCGRRFKRKEWLYADLRALLSTVPPSEPKGEGSL